MTHKQIAPATWDSGTGRVVSLGQADTPIIAANRRGFTPLLQISRFANDGGELIGRDPRDIPAGDWQGTAFLLGLKAIRAKCLDCALGAMEVRKCVQTDCPLWPLRMGSVPKGFRMASISRSSVDHDASGSTLPEKGSPREEPAHEPENDGEVRQ